MRDILVCTHGSRDVCWGKFGYAIYKLLRARHAAPNGLRVWRTSHIGGHRFASTLLDFPRVVTGDTSKPVPSRTWC